MPQQLFPHLLLWLNLALTSHASTNVSSPPTHDDPKNKKIKILNNKTTPPTQNSKPQRKNLKHFHKTKPTHKNIKTKT
jgi:hypothetical protein